MTKRPRYYTNEDGSHQSLWPEVFRVQYRRMFVGGGGLRLMNPTTKTGRDEAHVRQQLSDGDPHGDIREIVSIEHVGTLTVEVF